MDVQLTVLIVLLSPLTGLVLLPLKRQNRLLFFTLLTLAPALNTLLLVTTGVQNTPVVWGPLAFSLDRFSFVFAVMLNVCWALTVLYSKDFVRYHFQDRAVAFYGWFSLAISLISFAGLSDNLLTLYLFYLLSIPVIYPLVTFRTGAESEAAGRWYLFSTLGPALLIALPALVYVNQWVTPFQQLSIQEVTTSDTAASIILATLIVGFSKNCVAPFWAWLPKTSIAPAPVSGLVHSVGAVHTGTIAVLKIIVYLFGYSYMERLSGHFLSAGWLIYLCGFTALYTAYRAYQAQDLKKRFSYSTVGQLSYVITAGLVGTPGALIGAILHIASHSLAKLNLFFVAGLFNSVYATVDAGDVARIVTNVRWLAFPIAISGLSISGFPLLAGFYSKDMMLLEEISHHQYAAAAFLVCGSLLNFLYIFPLIRAAIRPADKSFVPKPIPRGLSAAVILSTLLLVALSFYSVRVIRLLE